MSDKAAEPHELCNIPRCRDLKACGYPGYCTATVSEKRTTDDRDAMALICETTGCTTNKAMALWDRLRSLPVDKMIVDELSDLLSEPPVHLVSRVKELLAPQASDGQNNGLGGSAESPCKPGAVGHHSQPEPTHPTPPQGSGEVSPQEMARQLDHVAYNILCPASQVTLTEAQICTRAARMLESLTAAPAQNAAGAVDAKLQSDAGEVCDYLRDTSEIEAKWIDKAVEVIQRYHAALARPAPPAVPSATRAMLAPEIPPEPTEKMLHDGAYRLLRFEDDLSDTAHDSLQWSGARKDAGNVWRSMWLAYVAEQSTAVKTRSGSLNITVWKDGSYLCQKSGDDLYSRDDPEWLCSIPLVSVYAAPEERRMQWLANLKVNSWTLGRDEGHACNYVTAKTWIEEYSPQDFSEVPPESLQAMKDSNTIWSLQIYPNTPVGFNVWYRATMEEVIDAAMNDPCMNSAPCK